MRLDWTRSRKLALCCLIAVSSACGSAQSHKPSVIAQGSKLRPDKCTLSTAEQRAWLGPDWQPFLSFVKSCPVARSGSTALYVISVWQDEYESQLPKDATVPRFPKPLILSKNGKILGRLPVGFPRDAPRSSDVTFSRWSEGLPRRIRVEIDDPAVMGNSIVMLEWDAQAKLYSPSPTKQ